MSNTRKPDGDIKHVPSVYDDGADARGANSGRAADSAADPMTDPVTGWLVVIDGPGKGRVLELGQGENSVGRENQRVTLDFGDEQISRSNHAIITYRPKEKAFYIQQGPGTNLVYVNNGPILSPTPIEPMSRIALGATTLIFVPLCGEYFSWDK